MMNEKEVRTYRSSLKEELLNYGIGRLSAFRRNDTKAFEMYSEMCREKVLQIKVIDTILQEKEVKNDSTVNKK